MTMPERKPLVGLCPIGKFVFSNQDALRQKAALQERLRQWEIPFVDLEGVLEDGLVKDQKQVPRVVDHLRRAGAECLFLPHCNFGTEGAAGMIAAQLGLPTLLWGPRDEAPLPDGTRLRDTLCGLLASSKVLHKLGVRFSYIGNCGVDEPALREGVDRFCRAVRVADVLRNGARVALIGQRIDFFWSTIVNESELLERFKIELVPVDMVEFIAAAKDRAARGGERLCARGGRAAQAVRHRGLRRRPATDQHPGRARPDAGRRCGHGRTGARRAGLHVAGGRDGRVLLLRRQHGGRDGAAGARVATSTGRSAACCCGAPRSSPRPSTRPSSPSAIRTMTTPSSSGTPARRSP